MCSFCSEDSLQISGKICAKCGKSISADSLCSDCAPISSSLLANRSVVVYNSWAKEILEQYKFRGNRELALPIGRWMADTVRNVYRGYYFTYITYVPLHPIKWKSRGFNQSQLLAEQIGKRLWLPVRQQLVRVRHTDPQSQQGKRKRIEQIQGSFRIQGSLQQDRILLVDDVYTTGATLRECANLLQVAGATEVHSITFAR